MPVPMTWEVYGDQRATFEDCFRMFNPLTRQAFDATVESWTAAVFMLLTLAPSHPEIAPELAAGAAGAGQQAQPHQGQQQGQQQQQEQQQQHQQQQQQQQGQVQQGSDSGSREGSPSGGAPPEAAAGGSSGNASASKALEIAAALKQHAQQGGQQEEQQVRPVAAQQQDAAEAAAAAESVQRMLGVRRGAVPRQRGGRLVQTIIWLVIAGAGGLVKEQSTCGQSWTGKGACTRGTPAASMWQLPSLHASCLIGSLAATAGSDGSAMEQQPAVRPT